MSLPDGLATRLSTYRGTHQGLRSWLRDWLQAKRTTLATHKPQELESPVAFVWLSVIGPTVGSQYAMHEFSYGVAPEAPEGWPEVPLELLLRHVLAHLS
jgi:hypothetical protein